MGCGCCGSDEEPTAGNEPDRESAFKQQKLEAWHPILTPWVIVVLMFAIAFGFVPIGVFILTKSNSVVEQEIQYDNNEDCKFEDDNPPKWGKQCTVTMEITAEMTAPIYVYYGITNFYQNHRKYVRSRNEMQLTGILETKNADENWLNVKPLSETLIGEKNDKDLYKNGKLKTCSPIETNDPAEGEEVKVLYPCGLIANSMFNDKISAKLIKKEGGEKLDLCNEVDGDPKYTGCDATEQWSFRAEPNWSDGMSSPTEPSEWIAWDTDVKDRYKYPAVKTDKKPYGFPPEMEGCDKCQTSTEPPTCNECYAQIFKNPAFDNQGWLQREQSDNDAGGKGKPMTITLPRIHDQDFIVWMKSAGLPDFRKLHRVIRKQDLEVGDKIEFTIYNFFQVKAFQGTKSIVLLKPSMLGGKQDLLAYCYIVFGIICLVLGIIFLIGNYKCPRELSKLEQKFKWYNSDDPRMGHMAATQRRGSGAAQNMQVEMQGVGR